MFQQNETVYAIYEKEQYYGVVSQVEDKRYCVYVYAFQKEMWFDEQALKPIDPIVYDSEGIRAFFRYEGIDFSRPLWIYQVKKDSHYTMTAEEFLTALNNMRADPSYVNVWSEFLLSEIIEGYDAGAFSEAVTIWNDAVPNGFPTTERVFVDFFYSEGDVSDRIERAIEQIKVFIGNQKKPFYEWKLTKKEKEDFLRVWESDEALSIAGERVVSLIRKYALELAEEDNEVALRTLAYGYYLGGRLFDKDDEKARDFLLRLLPFDRNGMYANSLGYIYYYGRCNHGIPQYEEAFRYFSIGHCHGIYESSYKLSDLFYHGYGVPQSREVAVRLVRDVYSDCLKSFLEGDVSKFPDAALRMGDFAKDDNDGGADYNDAYYYYLQAEYALRVRRAETDYVGDDKVYTALRKKMEEVYPKTEYCKGKDLYSHELSGIFKAFMGCGYKLCAEFSVKDDRMELTITDAEENKKFFVTIPQENFCGRVEKLTLLKKFDAGESASDEESRSFIFDDMDEDNFYRFGEVVATLQVDQWKIVKSCLSQETYKIASCRFYPDGKNYDYICGGDFSVGDKVTVDTPSGKAEARIVRICCKKQSELFLPIGAYKRI